MSKVTNKVNPINYDWWKEDEENSQETTEIPESVVVGVPKEETKDDTTTVSPPSYKRPIPETVVEENPDKELLERMQMSADLSKFATGLQWDSIYNTLRNAGINPVSAKIAEDRLKGDKEVGDYLTQIGMPVDEDGYLDMTYKPTEKGWGKKIYDEYIKKGYLEAERDANGNIVNLRRNREASVAPFIEEAVRSTPLPKSFTAGSQSKYFSDITQSVIAQMPKDENGRILYNGQYFPFEEVYTGLYPAIAQKVHEDMLDSNKAYFDANFLRATGQTYEEWYRDYASKRVDEMEVRIGELRDAVAADAEKVAYAKGREVAMSSATLVPASVLGWASGKGAAAESKKMFDDALEEINNFRKNNFGSGFQESFDTLGFLTFGLADLGSTYTQMQLLEKARRGDTLSDTEKNVLELLNIQQEFATIKENLGWEASLGSKIGSGVGATVEVLGPFGGAMMGTSMVGNVVKLSTGVAKGAFKANVKAVGKNILNNTLVGYMRGAIAAPLMPNTYTEYTKALKSQYKFNEDGSISFTPTNKRLAYMSAYIDGMNEIASEVFGSTIGELIGYGARTFGRVAKLNKVVDALYTPVSKKVDDVLSKVGDTPKAMAFRRAVSNFVDPMKGLDPETRELLRVAGVQDGILAEATSEVVGDFMATVMKDMAGAEVNYDDYHDKDFWLMQLAVAGLYGGTMSTIGKAGEAVSTYDYIAGVGEQNRRIIDSVESAELRDMLLAITADGNIDRAYIKLAGIDWSAYHPTDKDKAASFVRGSYALHAAMGSVQEDKRAKAFAAEAQKLTSNAYRGKDGYTPVSNDPSLIEVESEGRKYYVIAGVPADKSDTSMLTCVDMETGEQKAILAAKANVTSIKGVNEVLQQRYNEMFSAQVEAERIESIKSAYGQMERPTAEIAKSLMAQCGIIPPKEGDVVTLADGRSVEVMQDLEDGTYVVRLQDKVPLLFTVPFYSLKSNDTLTASAQELMLEGKVESATREAVEVAEKAVENGAEVATTEAPSAQSNTEEQRFSIKETEVASEAQTTMEAQETEVANAVEDMENIPTTEDGEVDYDAIKSPTTFAKTYVKEAGSVKQAHTEVKEMRAAAEQELQKIVERGGKEYTASKKRAAAREQRAIQERIAFYDAVAREMELLETKTEAEFSNIIENEYSVQVSAPVKKVVDGLAKELGLKVRFVEDANGQNAYISGNEVVITYKNRQKSIAFLIGHEYTHRMQDASPKQYAKFKSMVREAIGEERWNSLVENLKKEYEKQRKPITDTQLEDEVTADAAGELVENRDVFIEHLQHKADVGFLGFLRTIFRGLANTLRRIGATDREKTILDIVSQLDYLIDSAARNVAKVSAQGDARYSARITPEMDTEYLEAVEKGDMETAQRMVMEAAKLAMPNTKVVDENGNPKVVYHGTNHSVYINRETGQNWDELDWRERMEWDERDDWDEYWEERDFNTFSRVNARTTQELDGFFFAPEYDEYHEYGDRTIKAFLNIENPASFGDYNIDSSKTNAGRDERIRLQNEGYDGVINEEDGAIWEYVAFNPNQIKSADPVTYDDAGNVIPLSERFNTQKEDIRYSMMSSIRALNDALIDYYDTHDIEGLLSDIQEINEKLALNHPYLANTILDYVEDGNADMVVERIKYLVDGFDEGYEYTTGEDIRYSLIGEQGAAALDMAEEATTRLDDLAVAREMETSGKDAKAIRMATGWERGADGLWRYEIMDISIINPYKLLNLRSPNLSDIVDNADELFAAYPQLADIKVKYGKGMDFSGIYYNREKSIKISVGLLRYWEDKAREARLWGKANHPTYDEDIETYNLSIKAFTETLVHEIQHAIQHIEGFAEGGNSRMVINNSKDDLQKLWEEWTKRAKAFNAKPSSWRATEEGIAERKAIMAEKRRINSIQRKNSIGSKGYNQLAGEVEARNVSARINMTPEERRATLLSETEDVAREDQIFLREGAEMAKKKSTEETASPRKSDQPTAISSADGAKILKKLDNLAKKYQEKTNQTKTLIGDLADALDIDMPSKSSKYLTIEAVNGNVVTIRISNHGATASNHDANNEKEAISIVIANKYDGVINAGNAHIIEYFYDAIKLRKAEGKPIVDIIQSIKQAFFSGVYIDKTGIAQRIEINAPTQTLTTSNGEMVADVNEAQGQALFSLRTYREGGRDVLADFLATRVKDEALTESEASEMMQQMDDIYAFCETMKGHYAPFGQWSEAKVVEGEDGKPALSVIKANGDYAMNLDFSLVCKKRRTLDAVLNKMVKSGMITNVSQKDTTIAKINEVIRKYGFETACALCFVDARRFQVLKTARAFCDLYNGVVNLLVPKKKNIPINEFNFAGRSDATEVENGLETMSDDALNIKAVRKIGYQIVGKKKDGSDMYPKTVVAKIARHLVEHPEDRRYVSPSDFVSTAGFDKVKATKPAIMSLYNSKKGTGGPKAAYSDVQYLNDIIKADWDADAAYAVGGVRVQSFSDYVPRMVFDYIQMVAELAAKKLPAHAYTKEPLFAKTFGLTGMKINLSLVPDVVADGIAAGLDANGNYVWKTNETFPYEEAVALQEAEGYCDNCGTIAVGVSDAHILKMLDDPNIRMVIPYHKSGLPKQVAKMNNVATFTDYTNVQNTTRNGVALSKEDAKNVPNYNELLREHKDARKAAQAYVDWCTERGYTPKFAKFATHPNYYKLLEDFTTMVDGKYAPQEAVTFTFPTEQSAFGSLETLIEQGLEEDAVLEGMRDERVDDIVDEVGEVLGVKPKFSLIGEKGAAKIFEDDTYGSPAVDLEVAREMEAEGKDALSIRLATGWERGADDKWRYEIMDGEYHHPADMSQPVRLSDILDNPALYEAYPDLADMKVEYKPLDENRNGYYDGKGIVINSEKDQAQNASTLIHEIQHAIQHREGFAQGGSSKSFEEGLDEIEAKLTVLKGDFDNLIRSSKGEHLLRRLYIATKALGKMLQINYLNAKKDIIEYDAYQRYRKLAGEVEARNVQARHAMSRHERAWTPIGETEDVARESQEFVYRTAQSSSDAPRYSVRREDVDNGNIDNVIESLDTARTELERITRDKKLTNAEKNAVMRGVKALISQELRDGLSRFTRKNDILRMMDAVNEAKAPDAMLNAVIRAMRSIYGIKYRKEYARMRSLTKSKITLGVTNVTPEDFLDRLVREKKITDTEARRVIDNYWKGVNASGVSIAKYVDNDTRQVMEFVNAMMDIEKAKALLSPEMKKKMSLDTPPQDIIRAVRTTIENDEIADGKLAEALKDESLKQQIIDITDVLEEYWTALDQYSSITEDKTPEEANSVMPDIIKHMANANDTIEGLLKTGKVKLSEERKQRKMQERYLIYDALQDMGVTNAINGRILEDTRDFRRRVWHRVKGEVGKWPGIALGSMEYMLRKIGVNAPMGEGRIFNHFAPKLQRAYDKTFAALAECDEALDDKCKSLWGKTYAEMQKMAENTKVGQTYHERDIYVTQAIYLLAMWEQPDARAALEKKQGMDVALVDKIRQALDALDPRWREFSEWVVKEFLPSRREKYNAVHRKIFGTSLGYVPNYFPIKRAGESIHSVVDVSIPEMDALPSTIVGSIVERTKNVLPIDVETSFFEALNENITTMEGWAEMVGIIRDFNTLLSNRMVREAMNDIAPYMYSDFKKAAQVATLSYVGKTPDFDKNVGTILTRMWAGTKISFRLYTAFKQLSSALLFAGYSADPKFQATLLWRYLGGVGKMPVSLMNGIIKGVSHITGHSLTNIDIMTNIEWCMENLPSFRQRWESGVAGFEVMKRTLGNKSWKQRTWVNAMDEVVQKVAKFGFKPNAFIDAFTVAAGARTIFDYEYERLQEEEGYNEEQARVLAIVKAEMAFNSSQQSSEGLYLAPIQVDRSLAATAASTFMNASFAMSRNATQGIYELFRSASKELAEIEDMTYRRMLAPYKKVIKETIAEERAAGAFADENAELNRYTELLEAAKAQVLPRVKEIAKKKLRDAKIKAVLAVVIYGYGGQFAFQLMAGLPTLLFGDDDEEKKQIVKDTAINSLWSAPLSMIPVINLIPAAVAGYDINLFPAVDELGEDIGKILKGIVKDGVNIEVAKITVRLGLRWGLGLDIDTWKNIYLGVESMFEDGMSAEAILKVMNGPETQIRKIIGQRRDDESEKEYIERIMRFYSIAENPMFSAYPDAGKYYEGYEIEGKGINYYIYHGGSPMGMTDRDMQRIDYEKAYRRNIVLRYGGGKEYARHQDIDEKFNEYAKTIGSPNDVYWRGYYEPKMENLGEKEWIDLMTQKAEVDGYEKWLQHFTGSDESYYEVVKEVEVMKQKFNETYEQFK